MPKILIKGGTILSLDPSVGDLREGDLLLEDGRIVDIGPLLDVADCDVIDAAGMVVMPGLIDAHRHLWYAGLRGSNMDGVFADMVAATWGKLGPAFTPADVYAFTRAGIAEALDNGITAVFDWCHVINTPEHAEAGVQAHKDMGMRAVFGYGASMTQKLEEFAGEFKGGSWDHAKRLRETEFASDDGRLTMALALQGLDFTTLEVTREDIAAARDIGVPMSFHVGVPMGPPPKQSIKRLSEAGLLGTDMSFAHCCDATDEEFELLAAVGGRGMSCPVIDAALGMGASPTSRMRANGVAPCFTADAVVATTGDMFEEARVGLLLDRYVHSTGIFAEGRQVPEHGSRITAREALEGVTVAAANNCWLQDRVGSLAPGKRADVILLRATDLNLWPLSNVLGTVVSCAHGGNVDTVLVDGDIVKRGGELVGVDRAAIREDVIQARDRLYAAGGYNDIEPAAA
jgi:5-methylthioadenosine/S-adenosylhomocysteine deaminase